MRIPGKRLIWKSSRWLRSRFVNRALILGYHRVAEVSQDPYSLCVTPENFYEQMQVLRNYASPLSLDDLISTLKADNLPPRAVALTFDDGYADILNDAKSILDELQIPATVFVITSYMGKKFWWDELSRIILDVCTPNQEIRLRINAQEHNWILSGRMNYAQRHEVLFSIYRALRRLPADIRQKQLEQISVCANGISNNTTLTYCMTANELNSLIQGGLIDIGAHGISHTDLTLLPPKQYATEITRSKEQLEKMIGKFVAGFSYPHGSLTQEIKDQVREADYHYACASYNDVIWQGSDLFSLPRYWIPDINGQQFYRWLRMWV